MHTHTHTYIYIYINQDMLGLERERERSGHSVHSFFMQRRQRAVMHLLALLHKEKHMCVVVFVGGSIIAMVAKGIVSHKRKTLVIDSLQTKVDV